MPNLDSTDFGPSRMNTPTKYAPLPQRNPFKESQAEYARRLFEPLQVELERFAANSAVKIANFTDEEMDYEESL